jgi:hypothetical protein
VGEGDFDLVSGGSANWTNYDEATYVYEEITGDFDRQVRVEYQDPTSQWARAGLHIREALDEGVERADLWRPEDTTDPLGPNPTGVKMSQNFSIRVNPEAGAIDPATGTAIPGNNAYELVHRPRAGFNYDGFNTIFNIQSGFGGAPGYPNAWMRLEREGQTLRAWKSADGQNWGSPATITYQDDPDTAEDERLADRLYVGVYYAPEFFNNNIIPEGGPNILNTSSVARFRGYGPVGGGGGDLGPLTIGFSGANLQISWPAGQTGTLQSAPAVTGPWNDVAGATSPYNVTTTGSAMFYRLRQ